MIDDSAVRIPGGDELRGGTTMTVICSNPLLSLETTMSCSPQRLTIYHTRATLRVSVHWAWFRETITRAANGSQGSSDSQSRAEHCPLLGAAAYHYQWPHSINISPLYFHTSHLSCDKFRHQKWMFVKMPTATRLPLHAQAQILSAEPPFFFFFLPGKCSDVLS